MTATYTTMYQYLPADTGRFIYLFIKKYCCTWYSRKCKI